MTETLKLSSVWEPLVYDHENENHEFLTRKKKERVLNLKNKINKNEISKTEKFS